MKTIMKVLVVFHFDDTSGGVPGTSAIIKIPEGKTKDDVFLAWVREKKSNPAITMDDVNSNKDDEFMYYWTEDSVEEMD